MQRLVGARNEGEHADLASHLQAIIRAPFSGAMQEKHQRVLDRAVVIRRHEQAVRQSPMDIRKGSGVGEPSTPACVRTSQELVPA
jgi:hypothetical protein